MIERAYLERRENPLGTRYLKPWSEAVGTLKELDGAEAVLEVRRLVSVRILSEKVEQLRSNEPVFWEWYKNRRAQGGTCSGEVAESVRFRLPPYSAIGVVKALKRKEGMAEMHNECTTPLGPRQSLCIFDIKSRICGLVHNTNTTFILYIKYNKYTDNMIGDPYSEPNNDREAWAILTLECAKGKITGWRIGYGNAVKITRVAEQKVKDEKGVMKELLKEIRTCRKKGTLLITFHRHALTLLRTKLLILGIDASLRGLRNVCVEEIMSQYFNTKKIPVGDDVKHDPNALWAFFKKIGSLVPQRVLEGDLL